MQTRASKSLKQRKYIIICHNIYVHTSDQQPPPPLVHHVPPTNARARFVCVCARARYTRVSAFYSNLIMANKSSQQRTQPTPRRCSKPFRRPRQTPEIIIYCFPHARVRQPTTTLGSDFARYAHAHANNCQRMLPVFGFDGYDDDDDDDHTTTATTTSIMMMCVCVCGWYCSHHVRTFGSDHPPVCRLAKIHRPE